MFIIHHFKHVRKCLKSRNYIMDIIFVQFPAALKRLEHFADNCPIKSVRNLRGTKAYKLILYALENHLRIIRPCYRSGTCRFTHYLDHTVFVCTILDLIGIQYLLSNDAPRGGKCGNYIQLYLCE